MTRYGVTLAPASVRREIKRRWMVATPAVYIAWHNMVGFPAYALATKEAEFHCWTLALTE